MTMQWYNRPENRHKYDFTMENEEADSYPFKACTVMLWNHFIECPWLLHRNFRTGYTPNHIYPDVLDLTRGLENERHSMFEVNSTDEFMRVCEDLLTRRLLFRTHIEHERVSKISEKNTYTERWTDELAVLINTDHPEIHDDLRSKLDEAKIDVENGKKFCLKLDFGRGLKKWFGSVCEKSRHIVYTKAYDTDTIKNISVFVLNCSKPISFFMSTCAMFCCFPCWLLSGGCCYYIIRKLTVDDIVEKFEYRVHFEGRGAREQEDTPCCGCGRIYHLPVLNLQIPNEDPGFFLDY